eukprot:TRINITY_DN753_c0_g3_i1.p1 TRINITY_DN753_c0_g3~~TRINITY_DN753_c0_g3_i1.p1  ORF type:complete len:128 (-),score=13.12 TRINITY_DN753_c0_g3_i1:653-1036(-)
MWGGGGGEETYEEKSGFLLERGEPKKKKKKIYPGKKRTCSAFKKSFLYFHEDRRLHPAYTKQKKEKEKELHRLVVKQFQRNIEPCGPDWEQRKERCHTSAWRRMCSSKRTSGGKEGVEKCEENQMFF